jgi:hypothetical protein
MPMVIFLSAHPKMRIVDVVLLTWRESDAGFQGAQLTIRGWDEVCGAATV